MAEGDPHAVTVGTVTALDQINQWPVSTAAAAWIRGDGQTRSAGDVHRVFELASVTKALFGYAVLVAVEEGSLNLDQPAGPGGSTVAHLLSHSSGLAPEANDSGRSAFAAVASRRIYSNQGFDVLGAALADATGMDPTTYFQLAVVEPLAMSATSLEGSPAHGARSSVHDLLLFCRELMNPRLIDRTTLETATRQFLPNLVGVLPGFGRQSPNPWGLGFEIRGHKEPHWTGSTNSVRTYGHFGAAGTFLWHDPELDVAAVALTDGPFGSWAAEAWPPLSDAVIVEAVGT